MEATHSSETSVDIRQTTRRYPLTKKLLLAGKYNTSMATTAASQVWFTTIVDTPLYCVYSSDL
jgi:hypothetical protein